MLVNEDNHIWILHDAPFSGTLHWIEYDEDFRAMTLVMRDGQTQDLGIKINNEIDGLIKDGVPVYTILTQDGKIKDMYMVSIVVRRM